MLNIPVCHNTKLALPWDLGRSCWASAEWCPLPTPSAHARLPPALCQVLHPLWVVGCGQDLWQPTTATEHDGQASLPERSGEHPSHPADTTGAWVPRDGTVGREETESIHRRGWAGTDAGQHTTYEARSWTMWVNLALSPGQSQFFNVLHAQKQNRKIGNGLGTRLMWVCVSLNLTSLSEQLPKVLLELPIYSNR